MCIRDRYIYIVKVRLAHNTNFSDQSFPIMTAATIVMMGSGPPELVIADTT